MDIKTLFYDLFSCGGSPQEYINHRFNSDTQSVITLSAFDYIVRNDGCKFYLTNDINSVEVIDTEYNMSDIDKNDIVVDIGANIGGFAIQASKKSENVYAYEPVRFSELIDNIKLNKCGVYAYNFALSNEKTVKISWKNKTTIVPGISFSKIISSCGGCDYLKCNAEGAEWDINPRDLRKIRCLEIELHNTNGRNERLLDKISETHEVSVKNHRGFGYQCISARLK